MDPQTQSAQISSSEGVGDGTSSAAKESKMNDQRVVLGSEKPREGVTTALRFPSQPGSFTPGLCGSEAEPADAPPDSPIKTSPVSERIKALEALAAKKKEPDFRSDGLSHFRDRYYDKSPTDSRKSPFYTQKSDTKKPPNETRKSSTEIQKSPFEKNESSSESSSKTSGSSDPQSPTSPFEVLGDLQQVNDFEETEEWMKTYLPPIPDFDVGDLIKGSVGTKEEKETDVVLPGAPSPIGVPDAFLDSPVKTALLKEDSSDSQRELSVEGDSEFDLDFLPTAYICIQKETIDVHIRTNLDSASPAPPIGFETVSPDSPPSDRSAKDNILDLKTTTAKGDLEPPEAIEMDSSGDSDDTVIEDGVIFPVKVSTSSMETTSLKDHNAVITTTRADADLTSEDIVVPPKSERKLMQVPTINVIETDDLTYSDEEMDLYLGEVVDEDYEVVKETVTEASKNPESEDSEGEQPETQPLETEFIEGYSPPSSQVDSDVENSPENTQFESVLETSPPKYEPKTPSTTTVPKETALDFSPEQSRISATIKDKDLDFPDNDDEWSDEGQHEQFTSFMTGSAPKEPVSYLQSDMDNSNFTAVRETCVATTSLSKTSFIQGDIYDTQSFDYDFEAAPPEIHNKAQDSNLDKQNDLDTLNSINKQYVSTALTNNVLENIPNEALKIDSNIPKNINKCIFGPDQTMDPESADAADMEPADSFVEFMRECLKSRKDDEPDDHHSESKTSPPVSQSPPPVSMDVEEEELTIAALKELGSSRGDDGAVSVPPLVPEQNKANPPNATGIEPSTVSSTPAPPCSQSDRASICMYSKEMEAIDEWVAEACHLAEHVLTAILTHISVMDLIHWRDPKKSGLVFGVSMLVLLSLAAFSIISVVSYLLLALLCVTITYRIYKCVVQAVQKSSDGHPFKQLMDKDVSIPPETFRKHVDSSLTYINRGLKHMSRLFLVEDIVDSLKLAVFMWLMTYVGAVFNGITILILADILLFSVPPIYEKNKTVIDQYIDTARTQVNATMAKLQDKLPGALKRSSKTE